MESSKYSSYGYDPVCRDDKVSYVFSKLLLLQLISNIHVVETCHDTNLGKLYNGLCNIPDHAVQKTSLQPIFVVENSWKILTTLAADP